MADVAESADQDHARMRKIMNPAFAASQLKSFLPLFQDHARKVYALRSRLTLTCTDVAR